MSFGARAVIRLGALRHNLEVIRAAAPGAKITAVVKANAYGHGIVPVATALADADGLAVARLSEALILREHGIRTPIVLLSGVNSANDLQIALDNDCELVVHCDEQISMLAAAQPSRAFVWLKVDTGMHRLGFDIEQTQGALDRLQSCDAVAGLGVMTHLANADDTDDATTLHQLARFGEVLKSFDGDISVANSPAIFGWRDATVALHRSRRHGNCWVRTGIALYGVSPFASGYGADLGLQPVMQFESRLVAVKPLRAGAAVGYGGSWRAASDTILGLVAAGYGDGYSRYCPSGTPVWINGRRVPLAGRVSMDTCAVDLGPKAKDRVGDPVTLWGEELPVEEVARHADTIPYQLVTGVSHRESARFED